MFATTEPDICFLFLAYKYLKNIKSRKKSDFFLFKRILSLFFAIIFDDWRGGGYIFMSSLLKYSVYSVED